MRCWPLRSAKADMEAQGVANTLCSLVRLQVPADGELRDALLLCAERTSRVMTSQNAANTVWALGELGISPDGLVRQAIKAAPVNAAPLKPEHISMTRCCFAKLHGPVIAEVERALRMRRD
jgi:hypothetical protein